MKNSVGEQRAEGQANYIDPHLAALERLREVLTPHGIQILNVLGVRYEPVAGLVKYGFGENTSPSSLTVEVAIPRTGAAD